MGLVNGESDSTKHEFRKASVVAGFPKGDFCVMEASRHTVDKGGGKKDGNTLPPIVVASLQSRCTLKLLVNILFPVAQKALLTSRKFNIMLATPLESFKLVHCHIVEGTNKK